MARFLERTIGHGIAVALILGSAYLFGYRLAWVPIASAQTAAAPTPTACEIQLQVVEGGRKQAEANVAALFVETQKLRAELDALKAAAPKKPEEKK
jgi:predicted negative regulator of RcsB-dependent stress response